jgi:hypothetical protein
MNFLSRARYGGRAVKVLCFLVVFFVTVTLAHAEEMAHGITE